MTNAEALSLVYVALGGEAADVAGKTNAEIIAAIATKAGDVATAATTSELPKVTSSNTGQVLTVDGGKWKAKDLPTQT